MASTYKTPGVYVEEISLFPPSVAQVDTAVPAFIGYTEFAIKNGEDLTNKPTKVFSLTEFESYFGKGDPDVTYDTYLDSNDRVTQVVPSETYYLYDCMRMFFANGGGKCYIVSVGDYDTDPSSITAIIDALAELEKEDEPTMIVAPDAVLAGTGLYDFQQQALMQCAKLQDRVLICDTLPSDEKTAGETLQDRVDEFREKIGINNLKYGAAYVPFINSTLNKDIKYRNVSLFRGTPTVNTSLTWSSFTSDNNLLQLINDMENARVAVDEFNTVIALTADGGILTKAKTFEGNFKGLFDDYGTANSIANLQAIYTACLNILASIKDVRDGLPSVVSSVPNPASSTSSKSFILKTDIDNMITSSGIKNVFETMAKHSNAFLSKSIGGIVPWFTGDPDTASTSIAKALSLLGMTKVTYLALTDAAIVALYKDDSVAGNKSGNLTAGFSAIASNYNSFMSFFYSVQTAAASYEKTIHYSMYSAFGTYKSIIDKVKGTVNAIPPSATVAGIYAMVDNSRGVWKAPANVSISSVSGPVTLISNAVQDDLNVDTTAGKSINAIRSFTGKGTLVWGARTLAGNDNEWRYISVRRFYNMVEESVKKASGQFVFEPNDANTWVKIKAMIENFLTLMWRQGALAGAKAEHAFFVKVGLGETMTADDILNGYLNVEIGMAVVRPAEFIILKFSHKMQES
jgi:phage tail sheath protein FI